MGAAKALEKQRVGGGRILRRAVAGASERWCGMMQVLIEWFGRH